MIDARIMPKRCFELLTIITDIRDYAVGILLSAASQKLTVNLLYRHFFDYLPDDLCHNYVICALGLPLLALDH